LSAIAHEYLISGACRILTYWAFIAMMFQIPMVAVMDIFRKQLEKSQIGNVVFWVSFCIIGQPVAVLIYSYQAYTSLKA
jgi:diacylglycerol O-acyltransferase 1